MCHVSNISKHSDWHWHTFLDAHCSLRTYSCVSTNAGSGWRCQWPATARNVFNMGLTDFGSESFGSSWVGLTLVRWNEDFFPICGYNYVELDLFIDVHCVIFFHTHIYTHLLILYIYIYLSSLRKCTYMSITYMLCFFSHSCFINGQMCKCVCASWLVLQCFKFGTLQTHTHTRTNTYVPLGLANKTTCT